MKPEQLGLKASVATLARSYKMGR